MRCIAHRGFAEVYPENTVTAVSAAAEHADAIEIDVRRCGSGELVVIHDERIDRLTDSCGRVADLSLSKLKEVDVLGSGDGVPSLQTVLETVPEGVLIHLELKEEGLATDVLDVATAFDVSTMVSSFSETALREVREAGDVPLAYLLAEEDDMVALDTATELGCRAIHPHWQQCTDALVERAHERNLTVNAWTVPSRRDAHGLDRIGVDGIIVDRPDVFPNS